MPKKETKSTKEIETTLAGIEKTFGKGSAMLMKDDIQDYEEGVIPTGSIILDMAWFLVRPSKIGELIILPSPL